MRTSSKRARFLAWMTVFLAAIVASSPTIAASKKKQSKSRTVKQEEVYRCRDAQGRSYFGQNIPPECMDADVEALDKTGRVVRVIPGKLAREAAAAQKEADDARKAAAQHDRTLIATYLSVADIERLRDQRLELLVQQAHVTEQYVVNLKERESRLTEVVRRYRPYSGSPKAPVLPDHVAEDIVNTVNGLQIYEQELAKNTAEQQRLRTEFNSDIARFKQLKGIN
jgi:cell division septum initiation protein DivIVA